MVDEILRMSTTTYDFHKEAKVASNYKFSVVNPQNGSNALTLSGTVQKPVVFELPTRAFNLSRTYLNFQYTLPTQDAGGAFRAWVYRDVMGFIDSMRLRTSQNIELANLTNFRMYTKLLKKDIEFVDYKTVDEYDLVVPNRGGFMDAARNTRGEKKFYDLDEAVANIQEFKSPDEPMYTYATLNAVGDAASNVITVRFPLGRLIGTIFELDKTLYFPETIFLHVVFGPVGRAGWAAGANPAGAGFRALSTDPAAITNFANIHLSLAVETNERIITDLMNQVNGPGMSVLVPATRIDQNTVSGLQQTVTIRYSAADGFKLRRIVHTCLREITESSPRMQYNIANGTYDVPTDTWTSANVVSYYVALDNQRVSGEMDIDCSLAQDWLANREHLKKSVIQDVAMYKREWHHQEDFSGLRESPDEKVDGVDKDNLTGGLDLMNKERKIDFHFRMNNAAGGANANTRIHYTLAECERTLFISQARIGLDVQPLPVA